MTLKELYETIKKKRENAERDRDSCIESDKRNNNYTFERKVISLNGEIDAYTDVLCLIESSKELTKIIFKTKDGRLLEKSPNSHYASGYDGKGYYLYRENGEDKLICSDNVIDIIEVAIESSGVLDGK